ncbi:MAG: type I-D CRISPR-associated protein Cas5/Csc1 [Chloroflexi bacterium]|nr:type I-D CRISPR-associated protein Cas5/Csc1 [Chloroflexota bacterium]
MRIYEGELTLWEHTYFASREIGILYETEPVVGNYALSYALGLARSPYRWSGGPRYQEDLGMLNDQGVYVTPASFDPERLRFAITLFNAQTDSYFSAYTNNAIVAPPTGWTTTFERQRWSLIDPTTGQRVQVRPNNFPQSGRIRMLGLGSVAHFFVLVDEQRLTEQWLAAALPRAGGRQYVRLGKFNSKAEITWRERQVSGRQRGRAEVTVALNAADLPVELPVTPLNTRYLHPAPILERCLVDGECWQVEEAGHLPVGLHYGVDG